MADTDRGGIFKHIRHYITYETMWIQGYQVGPGKLIALGQYKITMICWCQTISEIHCSPAMHNVRDKIKNLWCKISEWFMKTYRLWFIYGAVFLDKLCFYLYFSQNQTLSSLLRDKSDISVIFPPHTASHLWHLYVIKSDALWAESQVN